MIACNSIIQLIDNGELLDKINKYIAPEFSMKINDNLSLLISSLEVEPKRLLPFEHKSFVDQKISMQLKNYIDKSSTM